MIIDGDVHISATNETPASLTAEEMISWLDKAGIDKALTWLQPPYDRNIDRANRYVYESFSKFPDRILPFGWTDPHLGLDAALEQIRKCVDDFGFLGVKLNGAQNDFYIDDDGLVSDVIDAIVETGKILAFHIGCDAFDKTHPYRLSKIAMKHPKARIIAVHMGGVGFHDLTDSMIDVAKANANITLIGSAVRSQPILKAIKVIGPDRVCFGSDMPFELPHVEIAKYRALLGDELSTGDLAKVMGGNLESLLTV